ncbi:MAG: hypothetical protein JNG85_10555, partial [Spirochaetaceae bacterium]|nr:hypothetical protein [Spirochaetaceae bacterium]
MDAEDAARAGLALLGRNRPWGIAGARNRLAAHFLGLIPAAAAPRVVKPFLERLSRREP